LVGLSNNVLLLLLLPSCFKFPIMYLHRAGRRCGTRIQLKPIRHQNYGAGVVCSMTLKF
jgi:hypothetical protein